MKLTTSAFAILIGVIVVRMTCFGTPVAALADYSPTAVEEENAPVEDSMHEFMEYVFQPTYLRLKASMGAAPADNRGWKAIKSDSLILAESCNLLFSRKPDDRAEDWVKHALAAKASGAEVYKAARTKDFDATTTAWKSMLNNCNGCHKQFEDGKHILQP